ncbi:MAG: lipoate--protein ligase family protein [Terrimicrobiaceae bacterium]
MKKTFAQILFWDDPCRRNPAEQMACDEALAGVTEAPVLRTYRWAEPAVTFGYSQRLQNIQKLAQGRPVMRRWTGGGTVFHGGELTLGLAIPASGAFTHLTSAQIYQAIHEALLPAVREILPEAKLVALEDCRCGPVCFESPVAYDIVAGPRKILGGALRRSRPGILYQGSLHAAVAPRSLAEALAEEVLPIESLPALEKSAADLASERYSDPAWLNLR